MNSARKSEFVNRTRSDQNHRRLLEFTLPIFRMDDLVLLCLEESAVGKTPDSTRNGELFLFRPSESPVPFFCEAKNQLLRFWRTEGERDGGLVTVPSRRKEHLDILDSYSLPSSSNFGTMFLSHSR